MGAADDVPPLFALHLRGTGTTLLDLDNLRGAYFFQELTLRFDTPAPIPEPTTILLVGTGIAGPAVRRWTRGKKR